MACTTNAQRGVKPATRRTASGFARLFAFIEQANQVARERRALRRLADAALKDFGVSRADAVREGGRPWWDLPRDCEAPFDPDAIKR